MARAPVERLAADIAPGRGHAGMRRREREQLVARRVVDRAHVAGEIDIGSDEIERTADHAHLLGGEIRRVRARAGEVGLGIAALQNGGEITRVAFAGEALGGRDMRGGFDDGDSDPGAVREPDLSAGRIGADRPNREAMAEDRVVRGLIEPRRRQLQAGGENALAVAVTDEDVGFVEGEEAPDAIAELRGDIAGVIGERLGGLAPFPAAKPVLEGLRQVPVIERDVGGDSVREQRIDEAVVEVEALRIGRADAVAERRAATKSRSGRRARRAPSSARRPHCSDDNGRPRRRRCRRSAILPGVWAKRSQIEQPLPSSFHAPSIW